MRLLPAVPSHSPGFSPVSGTKSHRLGRGRLTTVMRCNQVPITILVLAALQIVAGPALGCPPSKTWTTGPDDEAGFVLAEGTLAAIRIAGPFEVPWSVGLLPDGSFLVTERPGRLQHVRVNADTIANPRDPERALCRPWRAARHRGRSRVRAKPSCLPVLSPRRGDGLDHPRDAGEVRCGQRHAHRPSDHLRGQSRPAARADRWPSRLERRRLSVHLARRPLGPAPCARSVRHRRVHRPHQDRRHGAP